MTTQTVDTDTMLVKNIIGAIDEDGVREERHPPSESSSLWRLNFVLRVWKEVDGHNYEENLRIQKDLNKEDFDALFEKLRDKDLVYITVRFLDYQTAELIALNETINDEELSKKFFEDDIKPQIIHHPQWGAFVFNNVVKWFEGHASWMDQKVTLYVDATDEDSFSYLLDQNQPLFAEQSQWMERILAFTVAKLLPLKNDSWLHEDQDPLTPQEFIDKLELETILLDKDGSFYFTFNDHDLFWGHTISTLGSLEQGITDSSI
ncbi:DUF2262 domain-containing protein [Commensalibacter oyaizuii]|uniref:DUF2262 domain-containing protein n=1 Tax=Commensalibacter oyaizuii TaxID=3043873 RepID=A0ABT6Q083_9PROT|nr:DUF2262 domain-containing protein [Commensalibacter sp. TBRC 16381]MDI2090510.1 DUF2262 domain-containing protein [Commensalibacter sp. TBRC 16381]